MQTFDDDLEQQWKAFHVDMQGMAEHYRRTCTERAIHQMRKELDALNQPSSLYKRFWKRSRSWSSRQLVALAHWIDPGEAIVQAQANEQEAEMIDAPYGVVYPSDDERDIDSEEMD